MLDIYLSISLLNIKEFNYISRAYYTQYYYRINTILINLYRINTLPLRPYDKNPSLT